MKHELGEVGGGNEEVVMVWKDAPGGEGGDVRGDGGEQGFRECIHSFWRHADECRVVVAGGAEVELGFVGHGGVGGGVPGVVVLLAGLEEVVALI